MGLHGAAPHAAQEGDPGYDGEPGSGRGGSGSRAGLGWAAGRERTGEARRGVRAAGAGVSAARAGVQAAEGECRSPVGCWVCSPRSAAPSSLPSGGSGGDAAAESSSAVPSRLGGGSGDGAARAVPSARLPAPRPAAAAALGGAGGPAGCAPGAGGSPPAGTRSLPVPGYSMEVNGHTGPICWIIIANPRACRGQGTLLYFRAVHAALTCARELIFGEGLGYSEDRFRE